MAESQADVEPREDTSFSVFCYIASQYCNCLLLCNGNSTLRMFCIWPARVRLPVCAEENNKPSVFWPPQSGRADAMNCLSSQFLNGRICSQEQNWGMARIWKITNLLGDWQQRLGFSFSNAKPLIVFCLINQNDASRFSSRLVGLVSDKGC